MAKIKTISIEARSDEKFKVEVTAGDRTIYVDQPKFAGGTDAGPNPVEYLFTSLAGCIATTARIVATQKNIVLNGMKMEIAGEFDPGIMLGKSTESRPGVTKEYESNSTSGQCVGTFLVPEEAHDEPIRFLKRCQG